MVLLPKAAQVEPTMLGVIVLQHPCQMSRRSLQHTVVAEKGSGFSEPAGQMGAIGSCKTQVIKLPPCSRGILNFAKPFPGAIQSRPATSVLGSFRPTLKTMHDLRGIERRRLDPVICDLAAW